MDKSSNRGLGLGFCMACMLLTIFLSALQLKKYYENNDSSSFKYREFLATSVDKYPLFTICYEKSENELKGPNLLNNNCNKDCYGRFSLIIHSNQHILVFLQFQTFAMFDVPIKYYSPFK